MPISILDFIVTFEQDLAELYKRLKTVTSLQAGVDLFNYMSEHSEIHSKIIDKASKKYHKPELNQKLCKDIHEHIKNTLSDELAASGSITESYDKLAKTEEQIGKMYVTIADYYKNVATYYTCISEEISEISKEELNHRDMILERKKAIPDNPTS